MLRLFDIASGFVLKVPLTKYKKSKIRRNNNVITTSTRRRRRRVDVVKTLSLRHYCVMCPLGRLTWASTKVLVTSLSLSWRIQKSEWRIPSWYIVHYLSVTGHLVAGRLSERAKHTINTDKIGITLPVFRRSNRILFGEVFIGPYLSFLIYYLHLLTKWYYDAIIFLIQK